MANSRSQYLQHLIQAKDHVILKLKPKAKTALVLGSGLNEIVQDFTIISSLDYAQIPNFPCPTVEGHSGKMILATYQEKEIIILQGRVHYYEGFDMKEVTFPIRLLQLLGIYTIILTNASGGLNPKYRPGDIMLIKDHINLQNANPLRGENMDAFGPRFPDLSNIYDKNLLNITKNIANDHGIKVHEGVYAGVTGPNYETPAEAKYLRYIGADAVGMSTVAEAIVAVQGGMKLIGISCVNDIADQMELGPISHEKVLEEAQKAMKYISLLVRSVHVIIDSSNDK